MQLMLMTFLEIHPMERSQMPRFTLSHHKEPWLAQGQTAHAGFLHLAACKLTVPIKACTLWMYLSPSLRMHICPHCNANQKIYQIISILDLGMLKEQPQRLQNNLRQNSIMQSPWKAYLSISSQPQRALPPQSQHLMPPSLLITLKKNMGG